MTRFVRGAASALAIAALAACSGDGGTGPGGGGGGGGGNQTNISMGAASFSPVSVTIPRGRRVVWSNGSGVAHTVTPDNAAQAGAWASANVNVGGTFSHTFNTAGTFDYHCNIHNGMTGTITVQP